MATLIQSFSEYEAEAQFRKACLIMRMARNIGTRWSLSARNPHVCLDTHM